MALQGRFPNSTGNFQHLYSISGLEHWGQEDNLKQAASAALEHCTHHYKSHKKKKSFLQSEIHRCSFSSIFFL